MGFIELSSIRYLTTSTIRSRTERRYFACWLNYAIHVSPRQCRSDGRARDFIVVSGWKRDRLETQHDEEQAGLQIIKMRSGSARRQGQKCNLDLRSDPTKQHFHWIEMKWMETGKSLILGILFCDRWSQFANARIALAVLARPGPTHGTAT
ncbi:hypothetical protein [Burkholderia diffusa]|uniref:hypothetical protein n=1 Tax=Burkholderia diffusa TaxID=488732 RepID=UPI0012D8F115|nr:hypothetical protein [Burkholderia diffusa]